MSHDTHHTFEKCRCVGQSKSGAAMQVVIDGVTRWVPESLIHEDSEAYKPGTSGTLVLPIWFCEKEGLV